MTPEQENRPTLSAARMVRFGIVGGSGVIVNQGFLMLFHGVAGLPLLLSSIVAIELSIINNFVWNSLWTWKYNYGGSLKLWLQKCLQYHTTTVLTAFIGNVLVLMALVKLFGIDYRIANLIGIAVGSVLNYFLAEVWVFRAKK